MGPLQDEDSVLEELPVPSCTQTAHPSDPFVNPRRSGLAAPTSSTDVQCVGLHTDSLHDDDSVAPLQHLPAPSPGASACTAEKQKSGSTMAAPCGAAILLPRSTSSTPQASTRRQRDPAPAAASNAKTAKLQSLTSSGVQPKKARTATCHTSYPVAAVSVTTETSHSDDEDGSADGAAGVEAASSSARQSGAGFDEDGDDGNAEEKALLEAAGALLPGSSGNSSGGMSNPHPWLVTDAFHVSLWYVLRYAGAALSEADLWACRTALSLTATLDLSAEGRHNAATDADAERSGATARPDAHESTPKDAAPLHAGAWTWTGGEESELLLRLVMRKPHSFTGRHLEVRYGEWLHVQPTLAALRSRHFLWWSSDSTTVRHVSDNAAATITSPSGNFSTATMLEEYDGARIARMVLRTAAAPSTETLTSVLQAVRGTELRLFLIALRHASKHHASRQPSTSSETAPARRRRDKASPGAGGATSESHVSGDALEAAYRNMPLGENALFDAIPGRKSDMIRYFMERRYSLWAPTAPTAAAEPLLSATEKAAVPDAAGSSAKRRAATSAPQSQQLRSGARVHALPVVTPEACEAAKSGSVAAAPVRRCFRVAHEEARVVAQCWDTHIGPVYAPHRGLKAHLVWMAGIFHVLTANSGAGTVGQQELKPLAATMNIAAPPTLLMVRPQLLLLLQSLRCARQQQQQQQQQRRQSASLPPTEAIENGHEMPSCAPAAKTGRSASAVFLSNMPLALLPRWPSAPAYLPAGTALFSSTYTGHAFSSYDVSPRSAVSSDDEEHQGERSSEEMACSKRSFCVPDVDGGGAALGVPPPVQLFGTSTTVLQEYRTALHIHRELYGVTDGAVSAAQRFRGKTDAFVSPVCHTVLAAVRAGVAAVQRHPLKITTPALAREAGRFTPPLSHVDTPPSLTTLLYQWGHHAEHLLDFTPLYRWFACLELLFPLLQSARRYAEANDCLRVLLYKPVYVLHHLPDRAEDSSTAAPTTLSPITYEFRYKTHRRGKWICRLAQNLTHLKRHKEALALLVDAQAGYRELAGSVTAQPAAAAPAAFLSADPTEETAGAALCRVLAAHAAYDEGKLPAVVQRRSRLLRVLWPSCAAPTGDAHASSGPSLAVYHAAWEHVRERYCRRHDRLQLEKSLATLHRRVLRYTPLKARHQLTTHQLADIAVCRVKGVRDAMDYMLWREPSSAVRMSGTAAAAAPGTHRPTLPVELFVLQHFVRQWNQQSAAEEGERGEINVQTATRKRLREGDVGCAGASTGPWCGAHCEGQWIRCLAHALLWDCYWAYPAPEAQADHPLLWISAFQDGPLDVTTPLNFLLRRRTLVEKRLAELERCSRKEVVSWVAAHIKSDGVSKQQQQHRPQTSKASGEAEDESTRSTVADAEGGCAAEDTEEGATTSGVLHHTTAKTIPFSGVPSLVSDHLTAKNEVTRTTTAKTKKATHTIADMLLEDKEEDKEEDSVLLLASSPQSPSTNGTPLGQAEASEGAVVEDENVIAPFTTETIATTLAASAGVPEAWKVSVGSLPLLDILHVIPLAPLWRLLRCIYLSPITEGVPLRFSGFPDLIFWKNAGTGVAALEEGGTEHVSTRDVGGGRAPFCLMEVKSPSDTLSTKQIAVNDMLHRCGFQVCVSRVDAVHDSGEPVSVKRIR